MGLGFMNNKPDIGPNEMRYGIPVQPPHLPREDIWKILKGIGGIIATLALLGGLVWGTATLFAGTASEDELDELDERVELVEKNDIRQTILLEHIKFTLDKVEGKLDKALGRD